MDVTDSEQELECYDKSAAYYNDQTKGKEEDRRNSLKKWDGKQNYRTTHFSVQPLLLLSKTILPDIFHMYFGIVKMVLLCMRHQMNKQSARIKEVFSEQLLKLATCYVGLQ